MNPQILQLLMHLFNSGMMGAQGFGQQGFGQQGPSAMPPWGYPMQQQHPGMHLPWGGESPFGPSGLREMGNPMQTMQGPMGASQGPAGSMMGLYGNMGAQNAMQGARPMGRF